MITTGYYHGKVKKMTLETILDSIELSKGIKQYVLSYSDKVDVSSIKDKFGINSTVPDMEKTIKDFAATLGEDELGYKTLTVMMKLSLYTYDWYKEKGISDEIFIDTMKYFSRTVNDRLRCTGVARFSELWGVRQISAQLFRLGEIEFQIKHIKDIKDAVTVAIHIPTGADISPESFDKSLQLSKEFFSKYFKEYFITEYTGESWLLDKNLKKMLGSDSNIVKLQKRFDIKRTMETDDYLECVFNTTKNDLESLAEDTTLQRNMKKHLVNGGEIRKGYGVLID